VPYPLNKGIFNTFLPFLIFSTFCVALLLLPVAEAGTGAACFVKVLGGGGAGGVGAGAGAGELLPPKHIFFLFFHNL
tara:strand:+ start:660 stop:890 length:231 start_codon:yes stop_codon:yes gene_type:complete